MRDTDDIILRASRTVTTLQLRASLMLIALQLIAKAQSEEGAVARDVLATIEFADEALKAAREGRSSA